MADAARLVILRMTTGGTKYSFRPGALEYLGQRREANQSVGVSESGKVKVATISSVQIRFLEYAIRDMQGASETDTGTTIYGWDALNPFLYEPTALACMRARTFQLKQAGLADVDGNYLTGRYWAGEVTEQATGRTYAGKITFRVEAA